MLSETYWSVSREAIDEQMFKDYGRTVEDLNQCVAILKEYYKSNPHIPEVASDDVLKMTILFNKFSIERAKKKGDMYYTIRSIIPDFFHRSPLSPEMVLHSKVVYCVPLPKPTADLKRIIYCKMNPNYDTDFFDCELFMTSILNVFELIIQCDKCYSFHLIVDCVGAKLGHLTKFSPMVLKRASVVFEEVYSSRLASFYLVNFPQFFETILNTVIKPAFSPKLRNRITLHSNADILLEVFGKSTMPKDVGGDERSVEELNECVLKMYEEKKDRFELLRTLRVDESLRPQPLINDDILGYYGNFRTISVD